MNERIRELAVQAGWIYVGNSRVQNLEKFAELIVKECAAVGFNTFDGEPDAPASELQFYVRDKIKEHFGVK
jgi:hypothetical protein